MLFGIINLILTIIAYAVLVRCIFSFLPVNHDNKFIILLYRYTDPLLFLARKLTDRLFIGKNMPFDISPVVVILAIYLIRGILGAILR